MIARKFPIAVCAALACSFAGCSLTGEAEKAESPKTTETTVASTYVGTLAPTDQATMRVTQETFQNLDIASGKLNEEGRAELLKVNSDMRLKVQKEPGNSAAQFSLAVTSVALKMDDMAATFRRMGDNGLAVGGSKSEDLFQSSPLDIAESPAVSGRALAVPEKSATLRQLQDTLELKFLPTVDSLVNALQICWNDTGFRYSFKIDALKDSMAIGRADVGTALVAAQSVQNYLVWLISQDLEAGFSGQGFESQYAWVDSLRNIDIKAGPTSPMQKLAFENLKVLFPATGSTSSRNFLGIRAGYQAKVNAIPGKIIEMAKTMKAVADYAHTYQTSLSKGLLRLDADQKKQAYEAADSLIRMLSSPTTINKEPEYRQEYAGGDYVKVGSSYTWQSRYETVYYPGVSVKVDLAKIITLGSRQVFLPKFVWNDGAQWEAKGPFSLVKGSSTTSMKDLANLDVEGPLGLEPYIEWADPSFGGIFPDFKTTKDVLAKMEEADAKGTVVTPSSQLLPIQAGL